VKFNANEMIQEYSEWMRDNLNPPSVVVWDANNETWDPMFGEKRRTRFQNSLAPASIVTMNKKIRKKGKIQSEIGDQEIALELCESC